MYTVAALGGAIHPPSSIGEHLDDALRIYSWIARKWEAGLPIQFLHTFLYILSAPYIKKISLKSFQVKSPGQV